MKIQNSNNINFEAKKILTGYRIPTTCKGEIVDIFQLGKEDKPFMKKCLRRLNKAGNTVANVQIYNQIFKEFFESFVQGTFERTSSSFIAVKDGKITAVARREDDYQAVIPKASVQSQLSLLLALVLDAKKRIISGFGPQSIHIRGRLDRNRGNLSHIDLNIINDCNSMETKLEEFNPYYVFRIEQDPCKYNLEELLDINDRSKKIF